MTRMSTERMREYQRKRRERLRQLEFLENEVMKRLAALEERVSSMERRLGVASVVDMVVGKGVGR